MDLGLDGKRFLVLGASRGLGRAVAGELVAEGARVLVGARSPEQAARELGDAAIALAVDVAQVDADAVAAAVQGELGGLDGILLNSGGPPGGDALDLTDDDWQFAFDLLVRGPLRLLRTLRPLLEAPSSVLWVTSSSARQSIPGLDSSNLLRPGIAALVGSLARSLGPDVRVNAIAPGRIDTDRVRELDASRAQRTGASEQQVRAGAEGGIPLGRYGDAAELGRVGAFLLSPASSYISGSSIQVDGGLVTAVP
jgi:3-oxoacyl-[acyl-carrier protein] reductase